MLSRMRLDVEKLFIPHPVALGANETWGDLRVVFVTSKPVDVRLCAAVGRRIASSPVDYDAKFEDYYTFLESSIRLTIRIL